MPESASATSLESLVHGGFFRDAGQRIEQDIRVNGLPHDGYKKLLYSIYFRQVARLNEAREVLDLGCEGGTADVNGVFNYVQACLSQGSYGDALKMINRLALGINQDLSRSTDGLLLHLHAVYNTLQTLTAHRKDPLPSTLGRQPTYRIDNAEHRERSPSIVSDDPHTLQIRDAVFCPRSHTWSDCQSHDLLVQLLQANHDFSGFFGSATPSTRAATQQLVAQAQTVNGPALYVPTTLHFGHFLTQCAGYLHPLTRIDLPLPSDQPITCLLDGCLPEFFKSLIERGSNRPVLFRELTNQPLRAKELIVSDSSWLEWHYCNRSHAQLFARAAKSYLETRDNYDQASDQRVYFSRSKVTSGLRLSINELDLEARLEAMGFKIVHPQTIDIVTLIEILNSAEILVGSMGSAMHNLLFRTARKPLKTINLAHFMPPYNFAMIESILDIQDNFYFRACEEVRSADTSANSLYFEIPLICEKISEVLSGC